MLSTLLKKENLGKKECCEDSLWVEETPEKIVGVVADGCSDSFNSVFASRLLCYLLKKRYNLFTTISNHLIETIITELRYINELLVLPEKHLLSTFIPFIYNKEKEELRIRPFGDCVFYIDGLECKIDQNDRPDYIGYQIDEGFAGNSMYLDKYPELVYTFVNSFIVSSDGIDSLQQNQFVTLDCTQDPKQFLLAPPDTTNCLQRRYNILKRNKVTNSDDISIISYLKD